MTHLSQQARDLIKAARAAEVQSGRAASHEVVKSELYARVLGEVARPVALGSAGLTPWGGWTLAAKIKAVAIGSVVAGLIVSGMVVVKSRASLVPLKFSVRMQHFGAPALRPHHTVIPVDRENAYRAIATKRVKRERVMRDVNTEQHITQCDVQRELETLRSAQLQLKQKQYALVKLVLDQYAQDCRSGVFHQEREAAGILARCQNGDWSDVRVDLDHYVASYPKSPHVARLLQSCELILRGEKKIK